MNYQNFSDTPNLYNNTDDTGTMDLNYSFGSH